MHRKADKAVSRASFPALEPQLSASSHKSKNNKGHKTFAPFPMRDCSTSGANEYFHSLFSHRPPHSSPTTFLQSNRMPFGKTHVRGLRVCSCPLKLPDSRRHYLSLSSRETPPPFSQGLNTSMCIRGNWKWVHCIMLTACSLLLHHLRVPDFTPHTDLLSFSPHLHSTMSTNLRSHLHGRCLKAPFVPTLWSHCPPKPTPMALLSSWLGSVFLLHSHLSALQW